MYYEEKLIDGVWYYKTMPDGEWRVKPVQKPENTTKLKPKLSKETIAMLKEHAECLWACGYGDDESAKNDRKISTAIELLLNWNCASIEPAMSEAELLLRCQSLAMEFADDNLRKECEQAAFELAKKYRG